MAKPSPQKVEQLLEEVLGAYSQGFLDGLRSNQQLLPTRLMNFYSTIREHTNISLSRTAFCAEAALHFAFRDGLQKLANKALEKKDGPVFVALYDSISGGWDVLAPILTVDFIPKIQSYDSIPHVSKEVIEKWRSLLVEDPTGSKLIEERIQNLRVGLPDTITDTSKVGIPEFLIAGANLARDVYMIFYQIAGELRPYK